DAALWELLSVYADGEATPEAAARVESLLRSDPAYAREFAFLRLSADAVRNSPEVEPPAFLTDAILNATSHRPTLSRRLAAAWGDLRRAVTPGIVRYALPVGAVTAAAIVAVVFWPRQGMVTPYPEPGRRPYPPRPSSPSKDLAVNSPKVVLPK